MRGEPVPMSLVQVPPRLHSRPQLLLLPGGTSQAARGRQGHRARVTYVGCSGLMSHFGSGQTNGPESLLHLQSHSIPLLLTLQETLTFPSVDSSSPLCSTRPPGSCPLPPIHDRDRVASESHCKLLAPRDWEGWETLGMHLLRERRRLPLSRYSSS